MILFSVYVDDLITDLKLSRYGAKLQTSVIFLLGVSYTLILYFCLRLVMVCKNLSLHVNNMVGCGI